MKKERKKGRIWKVLLGILAVMLIIVGGFFTFVLGGKEKAINLELENVALETIPDGVYEGSYSGMRWSNTVAVTVENHEITDIDVIKSQVFIKPETVDALMQGVISEQSLDIDAVSSATADSHAFLAAVEDALQKAQQPS